MAGSGLLAPLLLLPLLLAVHAKPIPINGGGLNGGLNGGGLVNGGGGGPVGPTTKSLTGFIQLVNCVPPSVASVTVTVAGTRVTPSGSLKPTDGVVTLSFSKSFPYDQPGPWSVSVSISSTACIGGSWQGATSVSKASLPASVSFSYVYGRVVSLDLLATLVNPFISSAKLLLDNYDATKAKKGLVTADSSLTIGTYSTQFAIPRVTVDLDPCGICPDMGDGWFYVNGVNKMGGSFTSLGNALQLTVTFESDGVEIVGYHNKLGDGWVPDFNVNNAKVVATAKPVLIAATGQLSLTFPSVTFTADITATGGCSPFGFDICNWITGSSGKVQNAVKGAVNSVLNADATRNAIAAAVQDKLVAAGFKTKIVRLALWNGNIVIVT